MESSTLQAFLQLEASSVALTHDIFPANAGGRVVCASGSKTSVSSSTPTSAIIYGAYFSLIKKMRFKQSK